MQLGVARVEGGGGMSTAEGRGAVGVYRAMCRCWCLRKAVREAPPDTFATRLLPGVAQNRDIWYTVLIVSLRVFRTNVIIILYLEIKKNKVSFKEQCPSQKLSAAVRLSPCAW